MTLCAEIEAIGDELVAAFHARTLPSRLDYLLERLEAAAIRAAALEASCGIGDQGARQTSDGGVVIDFITRKERAR